MRIWNVITPERAKELVRVGALLKGKVIAVDGDRVLLDFGDFIGEGLWEATQPLPSEGDVVLVRIAGDRYPLPLRFVKRLKSVQKEVVARRVPTVVVENLGKETVKEMAGLLKLATKIAEATSSVSQRSQISGNQNHPAPVFVAIPLVVEQRERKVYMLLEREGGKESIYTVRILMEDTPAGDVRADFSYMPERNRRLMVGIFTQHREGAKILEREKEVLVERLKSYGFTPFLYVRANPKMVGRIQLISTKGSLEMRA